MIVPSSSSTGVANRHVRMNGRIVTCPLAFAGALARLWHWTVAGLRPVRFIREATRKGLDRHEIHLQCFMIDRTWLMLSFVVSAALLAMYLTWLVRSPRFDIMPAGRLALAFELAAFCFACLMMPYFLIFLSVREPFILAQRFLERRNLVLIDVFLDWLARHPEVPIVLVLRPFDRAFDARLDHVTHVEDGIVLGVRLPAALAVASHVCSISNPESVVVMTAGYLDAPSSYLFEPTFIVSAWGEADWRNGISKLVGRSCHIFFIVTELTDGIVDELRTVETARVPCCVFASDRVVVPLVLEFPRIGEWARLAIFKHDELIVIDPPSPKSERPFDRPMTVKLCTRVAVSDAGRVAIRTQPWTLSQREMTRYCLVAHGLGHRFVDAHRG